jgi:hypothetical protein
MASMEADGVVHPESSGAAQPRRTAAAVFRASARNGNLPAHWLGSLRLKPAEGKCLLPWSP